LVPFLPKRLLQVRTRCRVKLKIKPHAAQKVSRFPANRGFQLAEIRVGVSICNQSAWLVNGNPFNDLRCFYGKKGDAYADWTL
jgi:hypothetical protein